MKLCQQGVKRWLPEVHSSNMQRRSEKYGRHLDGVMEVSKRNSSLLRKTWKAVLRIELEREEDD